MEDIKIHLKWNEIDITDSINPFIVPPFIYDDNVIFERKERWSLGPTPS
jgi:hypothetical protein